MLKDIQRHYQSEMTKHGYKDYTFPLQLDEKGKLVIHVVNGKNNSAHYDKQATAYNEYLNTIKPELPFEFNNDLNVDSRDNVHLILVGGVPVTHWMDNIGMGFTWHVGRFGGIATGKHKLLEEFPDHYLAVLAHELGHAFALDPGHNGVLQALNGLEIAFGQLTEDWNDKMNLLKFEADLLKSRPIFREIQLGDTVEVEAEKPNKNPDLVENLEQGETVIHFYSNPFGIKKINTHGGIGQWRNFRKVGLEGLLSVYGGTHRLRSIGSKRSRSITISPKNKLMSFNRHRSIGRMLSRSCLNGVPMKILRSGLRVMTE